MASTSDETSDAERNRVYWDDYSDQYQAEHKDQLRRELVWGTFSIPEREIIALGEVQGLDVLELGCGAAQWSIFLAQRGGRMVGLDNSAAQLNHARALQGEYGVSFPLVHAAAESIPIRPDSFDLVFCDHGAMSFVDPRHSLPQVARVLRPGGRLVFNLMTPWNNICWNERLERADETLHLDYFGHERWDDIDGSVSWEFGYGDWIRTFRSNGFVIDDLIELRPSEHATSSYRTLKELSWSRRWPAEHIWCVHRD